MEEIRVVAYATESGRIPFWEWVTELRDKEAAVRIKTRVERFSQGNLGDHKSIGQGVFEARFHFGPGYRLYFAREAELLVLLLCGGDKDSQQSDILRALTYLADYRSRSDE